MVRAYARSTGRRHERSANHLAGGRLGSDNATDSLAVRGAPVVTPRRLRRLALQLSDRDRQVLDSICQLRLLQATQIERLHFREGSRLTQARRARAALARLHELGLVSRLDRRIGGVHAGSAGYLYRLSPAGRRLLDLRGPDGGRRRHLPEPTVRFQDHVLAVAELATQLTEADRADRLDLLRFEAEPACWRRFVGPGGQPVTLRPDAFVVAATGDYEQLSFVEVDLGTEGMSAIRRKAQVYHRYAASGREQAEHGVFPRVVFLAPSEQRAQSLQRTLHASPSGIALFAVDQLDDPIAAVAGGER